MKRDGVTFDPLDACLLINPPFSLTQTAFDAWAHIGKIVFLDPRRVRPMKGQPRTEFEGIDEFAENAKEYGQQTPINVFPINDPDFDVELIAGERRTRSCVEAGVMVRAFIRPVPANRKEQLASAVLENFFRRPLKLHETIKMVADMIAEGFTADEIAKLTNNSLAWVDQYTKLGTLDPSMLLLLEQEVTEIYSEAGRKLRRATLLPMSIMLDVARLDKPTQLPFAEMLIEEHIPIEAAKGLVKRRLEAQGIEHYQTRKRSPKELTESLSLDASHFEVSVARFLDMSFSELEKLAEGCDGDQRRSLVRKLKAIAREAEQIARPMDLENSMRTWHPAVQARITADIKADLIAKGEFVDDDDLDSRLRYVRWR